MTQRINRELIQNNFDTKLLDTIDRQGKIIYSLNSQHPKALFNEWDELEILENNSWKSHKEHNFLHYTFKRKILEFKKSIKQTKKNNVQDKKLELKETESPLNTPKMQQKEFALKIKLIKIIQWIIKWFLKIRNIFFRGECHELSKSFTFQISIYP